MTFLVRQLPGGCRWLAPSQLCPETNRLSSLPGWPQPWANGHQVERVDKLGYAAASITSDDIIQGA